MAPPAHRPVRRHTPARGRRWRLVAFALLTWSGSAAGQDLPTGERWRWTRFGIESGLPTDEVLAIVETPSGIPWAVTRRGAVWYDGFGWHTALPASEGQDIGIAVGPTGTGALVSLGGRLFAADTGETVARPVVFNGEEAEVLGAAVDPAGRVLILAPTRRGGTALLQLDAGGTASPFPVPAELGNPQGSRLWRGDAGSLWINAAGGLYRWDGATWHHELALPVRPAAHSFAESPRGHVMVFVTGPSRVRGLWTWRPGTPPQQDVGEGLNATVALAVRSDGAALAAYETGTTRARSQDGWRTVTDLPREIQDIRSLRFRPNGDLWLASGEGLYLLRAASRRWSQWSRPFADQHARVNALARARDGTLWMGTGAGLAVRPPDGDVQLIPTVLGRPIGPITAVATDAVGHVWIGSGSAFTGAFRWDGARWHRYGAEAGLTAHVHRIEPDRAGRLWFLTIGGPSALHGQGALVLDSDTLHSFTAERGFPDSTGRVYAFAEASDGAYWFGSATGLSRWHDGQWQHWPIRPLFAGYGIFTLAPEAGGRVWAADRVSGLALVHPDSGPRVFTEADGLVDRRVWDLARAPDGRLWIATDGGLGVYRDAVWTSIRQDKGLPAVPLWPLLVEAGRLLVGARGGGLLTLDLAEDTLPPPQVSFADPIVDADLAVVRWSPLAFWGQQESGRIATRYRLDDGDFSPWSTEREASLLDPGAGRHTLTVQTHGLFRHDAASMSAVLAFRVPQPLLLQPAFLVPLLVLSLALAGSTITLARRRRHALRERRTLELQLRQAQKLEAVGRLAGGIAHDFNNVLTAIVGNTELLTEAIPTGDRQARNDLAQIRVAAERGAAMVRKLLVFARGAPLEVAAVDLLRTASDLAEMLRRLLPETVRVVLPETNEPCVVLADQGALEQIVLNLATNARDAMPDGGELTISTGRRTVRQGSAERGSQTAAPYGCLTVTDTGTGMDEATRQRVFDPFFTTKALDKGTGLGMTMVYTLVRQQHGFVEITSAVGRGTSVAVFLPPAPDEAASQVGPPTPDVRGGRETVLIVEDDESIRSVTRRLLEGQGYTVLATPDGESALALLRETPGRVDLVLSDVVMPGIGGLRLYETARTERLVGRFVFTSGHTFRSEHEVSLPHDVPLLLKPWDSRDLLLAVRDALDRPLHPPGAGRPDTAR